MDALKVRVQPTPSVYELERMGYIGANWIQKFSLTVWIFLGHSVWLDQIVEK